MTRYSEHFATKEDFDLAQAKGRAFWESAKGRALRKAKDELQDAERGFKLAECGLKEAEEELVETRVQLEAAQLVYEALDGKYGDEVPGWIPDAGLGIGAYK